MSEQQDNNELGEMEQVNADLSTSLDRCRAMLRDCQTKIAANSDSQDEQRQERRG